MKLNDYVKQLRHPSHDKRMQAVIKLGDSRNTEYLQPLLELFRKEEHPFVEASLVKALAKVGGNDVLKDIAPCLKHIDARVRANTLEAFEECDSQKVFDITIPAFYDRDPRVRGNAAKLIWKRFNKKAIPKLKEMIQKRDDSERLSAIYVLKEIAEPVCLKLLDLLSPGAPEKVKIKALEAKAYIEDQIELKKKNPQETLSDEKVSKPQSVKSSAIQNLPESTVDFGDADSDSLIDLLPMTTSKSASRKESSASKAGASIKESRIKKSVSQESSFGSDKEKKQGVGKKSSSPSQENSPEYRNEKSTFPEKESSFKLKGSSKREISDPDAEKKIPLKKEKIKKESGKEKVKQIVKIEKQTFPIKTFAAICGVFILILIICNIFILKSFQDKPASIVPIVEKSEKRDLNEADLQDISALKKDMNNFSSRIQRMEQTLMIIRSSLGGLERKSTEQSKNHKDFSIDMRSQIRSLKKELLEFEKNAATLEKASSKSSQKTISPQENKKITNESAGSAQEKSATSVTGNSVSKKQLEPERPVAPVDMGGIFSTNLGDPIKLKQIKDLMVKGTRAMDYNNNQEALEIFKNVLSIEPEHLGAHYNMGVIKYYSNQREEALKCFEKCLSIDKGHANSQFLAAECCFEFKKYEKALKLYESYVLKKPSDAPALTRIAVIYNMFKKPDKAEEFYRRAISIAPDNSFASLKLVSCLVDQKKWNEAEEVLEPLLQEEPNNIEGLGYASRILYETGRKEQASTLSVKVLAESNNPDAAYVAAETAMTKGMKAKAARYYEMLLQSDGSLLQIRKKTADLLIELKKNDQALQHLDIIVAGDPENPVYALWLAQGLLKAGYSQEALYEFSRALKLKPDEKTKALIVESMKNIAESDTAVSSGARTASPSSSRRRSTRTYGYSKNNSGSTKKGVIRQRPQGLRPRRTDER